jgi:hypothetical protein
MVAVEQEQESRERPQALVLCRAELGTEQGDSGDGELSEAHDAPRAFDHHQGLVARGVAVMKAVEELLLRQSPWKLPFTEAGDG